MHETFYVRLILGGPLTEISGDGELVVGLCGGLDLSVDKPTDIYRRLTP